MLCSVLLILGQVWVTPVTAAAACTQMKDMPCCQHGAMPCCQARGAAPAKPASTVPVRVSLAVPVLVLLLDAWQAPEMSAPGVPTCLSPSFSTANQPLYERDCARLI